MGAFVDLTGQVFDRLTVKYRDDTRVGREVYWTVVCSCTPERKFSVSGCSLRSGRTKSCGCLRNEVGKKNALDLTGERFGRLVVISREGSKKKEKASWSTWKVRCDCGKEKVVIGSVLLRGDTQSCGCLHKDVVSLPAGQAVYNSLLRGYIDNACRRNLKWGLTEKQFKVLISQPCHYCNSLPARVFRKRLIGSFCCNGVDRIDNSLGYTPDNVVAACRVCNRAKGTLTYAEYRAFLTRAGKFQLQLSTVE